MAGYDPNLLNQSDVTVSDNLRGDASTVPAGVNQSGVGGYMQQIGQALTGSNNPFTNAALIPSLGMAAQQWHNAGQYRDMGNAAADRADPFGQYRRGYGDRLQALYNDPSQIENTPGYKFALNQALDQTQGRLASQGFLGSSQMQQALTAQASGLAQQTWNTEANRLAQLSGSQFDPANAARMQMEGGRLAVDSENAALGALMYPFGPGAGGGTTINNSNGSGGSNGGLPGGINPSTALQRLQQAGMNPRDAATLMRQLISDPSGVSAADMQIIQDSGLYNDAYGTGGVDTAPSSYDFNGFGGYGNVNGSTTGILNSSDFGGYSGGYGFDSPISDAAGDGFGATNPFDGGNFNVDDLFG